MRVLAKPFALALMAGAILLAPAEDGVALAQSAAESPAQQAAAAQPATPTDGPADTSADDRPVTLDEARQRGVAWIAEEPEPGGLLALGVPADGLQAFRDAELMPIAEDADALIRLGNAFTDAGDHVAAALCYAEARRVEDAPLVAMFNEGCALYELALYDAAIQRFRRVIASADAGELLPDAQFNLGVSVYESAAASEPALVELDPRRSLLSDDPESGWRDYANAVEGIARRYAEASALFGEALAASDGRDASSATNLQLARRAIHELYTQRTELRAEFDRLRQLVIQPREAFVTLSAIAADQRSAGNAGERVASRLARAADADRRDAGEAEADAQRSITQNTETLRRRMDVTVDITQRFPPRPDPATGRPDPIAAMIPLIYQQPRTVLTHVIDAQRWAERELAIAELSPGASLQQRAADDLEALLAPLLRQAQQMSQQQRQQQRAQQDDASEDDEQERDDEDEAEEQDRVVEIVLQKERRDRQRRDDYRRQRETRTRPVERDW
jgi:hypothetical protein